MKTEASLVRKFTRAAEIAVLHNMTIVVSDEFIHLCGQSADPCEPTFRSKSLNEVLSFLMGYDLAVRNRK